MLEHPAKAAARNTAVTETLRCLIRASICRVHKKGPETNGPHTSEQTGSRKSKFANKRYAAIFLSQRVASMSQSRGFDQPAKCGRRRCAATVIPGRRKAFWLP